MQLLPAPSVLSQFVLLMFFINIDQLFFSSSPWSAPSLAQYLSPTPVAASPTLQVSPHRPVRQQSSLTAPPLNIGPPHPGNRYVAQIFFWAVIVRQPMKWHFQFQIKITKTVLIGFSYSCRVSVPNSSNASSPVVASSVQLPGSQILQQSPPQRNG